MAHRRYCPKGIFQSAGDPKVGQNLSGPLEVFTVGSDSAMWHSWQTGVSPGWAT